MKKVAIMHYDSPPNTGGVEILLGEQAKILSSLGYEVTIVTGSGESPNGKIKIFEDEKIQSINRFNPNLYKKIVSKGIVDEEFFALVKHLKKKLTKFLDTQDIVIIHNIITLIHNLPLSYVLKEYIKTHPNKKYIIWAHDQTFIDKGKVLKIKEGVKLCKETENILFEPLPHVEYIVISNHLKNLFCEVMKLPRGRVKVITNGINIKGFLDISDDIWQLLVQKENLLKKFPIVFSPVNILQRKNLDYCIDIIAKLKKKYPDIIYIVSGKISKIRNTEEYFKKLKSQISKNSLQKNIIFISPVFGRSLTNHEIYNLYNLSDMIFYLTKSENFGLPIVEAYLAKTPIFVSDLEVFQEIGGKDLNYIDYKTVSPQKAGEKVIKVFNDNKTAKLSHKFRNDYSMETIVKEKLVPLFK